MLREMHSRYIQIRDSKPVSVRGKIMTRATVNARLGEINAEKSVLLAALDAEQSMLLAALSDPAPLELDDNGWDVVDRNSNYFGPASTLDGFTTRELKYLKKLCDHPPLAASDGGDLTEAEATRLEQVNLIRKTPSGAMITPLGRRLASAPTFLSQTADLFRALFARG